MENKELRRLSAGNYGDKHPGIKNLGSATYIVYEHIKSGGSPHILWKQNQLTKPQVKCALMRLKRHYSIKKIGFGTWGITGEFPIKNLGSINTPRHPPTHPPFISYGNDTYSEKGPDSVRMHAAIVRLQIPDIKNWGRRREIMQKLGLGYKIISQGETIRFEGQKVWLCPKSIVFYLNGSWFADTAPDALRRATLDLCAMIARLEKRLKAASFRGPGGYKLRFARQHHSLIKNALARDYRKKGQKLKVFDENGLWLIIDNSFNLDELETIGKGAVPDNVKVQDFFNSLKRNPVTTDQITRLEGAVTEFKSMLAGSIRDQLTTNNAFLSVAVTLKAIKDVLEKQNEGKP